MLTKIYVDIKSKKLPEIYSPLSAVERDRCGGGGGAERGGRVFLCGDVEFWRSFEPDSLNGLLRRDTWPLSDVDCAVTAKLEVDCLYPSGFHG